MNIITKKVNFLENKMNRGPGVATQMKAMVARSFQKFQKCLLPQFRTIVLKFTKLMITFYIFAGLLNMYQFFYNIGGSQLWSTIQMQEHIFYVLRILLGGWGSLTVNFLLNSFIYLFNLMYFFGVWGTSMVLQWHSLCCWRSAFFGFNIIVHSQ